MSFANVLSPFEFQAHLHQHPYLNTTTIPVATATMNNPTLPTTTSGSGFSFGVNNAFGAPQQFQYQQPQFMQQFQQPQSFAQPQPQAFTIPHPTKRPRGSYEEDLSEEAWAPKRTRVVLDNANNATFTTPSLPQSTQFGSAPSFPMAAPMEIPTSGAMILHPTAQKRSKRSNIDDRTEREQFETTKKNKLRGFFDAEALDDPSFHMRNIITVDNRLSAWKEDLSKAIILYPTPPTPAINHNDYERPFMQSRSYITEVDDEEESPSGMDMA